MKLVCANSAALTTELTKVGGVPPLVSMLNSGDTLLQRHAAQAISGLVVEKEFLEEIIIGGGIASLVGLLLCKDDETATYACIAIGRSVAANSRARKIAIQMGCLTILTQMAAGAREVGKTPEGVKYMDGGERFGETREFEENPQDKMGFGFNISAARGSGLGDDLCAALRCTREAAIAMGNFATDEELYILDGSSNFKDGRRVSGMLPQALPRQAPTTHQPSSDFSKLETFEEEDSDEDDKEQHWEEDELTGEKVLIRKSNKEEYVPEIAKRLARRTEADRKSVMTAYIERQEFLRLQYVASQKKAEEDASGSEGTDEEDDYWSSEYEEDEGDEHNESQQS